MVNGYSLTTLTTLTTLLHFSLFTFRFSLTCVHLRHLRNSRSDIVICIRSVGDSQGEHTGSPLH